MPDKQQHEIHVVVRCGNTGPDGLPGLPSSGKLPHYKAGLLYPFWSDDNLWKGRRPPAGAAGSLFSRVSGAIAEKKIAEKKAIAEDLHPALAALQEREAAAQQPAEVRFQLKNLHFLSSGS